jgi:hypothetical protein
LSYNSFIGLGKFVVGQIMEADPENILLFIADGVSDEFKDFPKFEINRFVPVIMGDVKLVHLAEA